METKTIVQLVVLIVSIITYLFGGKLKLTEERKVQVSQVSVIFFAWSLSHLIESAANLEDTFWVIAIFAVILFLSIKIDKIINNKRS